MNNGSRICLGGGDANRHSIGHYIVSAENILSAWDEFKKGKRKKSDIQRFEFFLEENMWNMHDELTQKVYRHSSYTPFYITDPKLRHIHKATVRDRLLHQTVFRVLYPIFDKVFMYDSYSCRVNKGTHRAVNRLDHFLRKASHNYHAPIYALKCDISRFFDSVDQAILKGLIKRRVNDETVNEILDIIIDSFEANTRKGIPLGNVTGGGILCRSGIYKILNNHFYYGWFRHNNQWCKGAHEPMITEDEFKRVQSLLKNKSAPRPKEYDFAFTGFIRCGNCGCLVTAESKVKHCKNGNSHHYTYYHCTHRKKELECKQASVELKDLEIQIKSKLSDIRISEKFKTWAIQYLYEIRTSEAKSKRVTLREATKEVEDISEQIKGLTLSYTAPNNKRSQIMAENEYIELKNGLMRQRELAEERIKREGKELEEWVTLTEQTFDFACYAHIWFENGDEKTKKAILSCLGSNLTLKDKKLNISLHPFFETFVVNKKVKIEKNDNVRTSEIAIRTKQNRVCDPILSRRLGDRDSNPDSQDQNLESYH